MVKGWVTSGTEFRKILSPLPCQLLPSSNISHLMRHHYSEAKHSRIKTINGTTSPSSATANSISISERERYMTKRRNDSLCEADGLPAIFPHQHQEREEEKEERYIIQDISYQMASQLSSSSIRTHVRSCMFYKGAASA